MSLEEEGVQHILRKGKVDKQINTKMMMSYFCGWHALAILVLIASPAAGENNHPLLELLSSRDEVVQIAGYGEEKLSTVLITGSVNCEAPHQPQPQPHAWPVQGIYLDF